MMEHLSEGSLQALLDDEMEPAEAAVALRHIAGCEMCESDLTALREGSAVLASALSILDSPLRAQREAAPPQPRARPGRWIGAALPRAAVLLLTCTAAAAAAALPGSPLRTWVAELRAPDSSMSVIDDRSGVSVPSEEPLVQSGVSVAPDAGRLRIVVLRPASDLRIRATITDSPRGGAFATGESASAKFSTGRGLVEVIDATGGELLLEIPSEATSATVELDGRLYLTKDGDQLRLLVASGAGSGAEVLFQPR